MREAYLSDGARDFGNGVIGPTPDDVEWANNLSSKRAFVQENSEPENPLNKFSLQDRVPKSLVKRIPWVAVPVLAGSAVFAGVCEGSGNKNDQKTPTVASRATATNTTVREVTPTPELAEYNIEAFLIPPVRVEREAKVVQGWKYNAVIRGTLRHDAIDVIVGTNTRDRSTWKPFEVIAPADGVACVSYYTDKYTGRKGNIIEIQHPNHFRTRLYHSDEDSVKKMGYPSCSKTKDTWLRVEQGDVLSESGDGGDVVGQIHAHWVTIAPGKLLEDERDDKVVDPYDLYTTRDSYPNLDFSDGKLCGKATLLRDCPIGKKSNEDTQILPTPEPIKTLAPSPVPEPKGVLVLDGKDDGVQVEHSESLNIVSGITMEARIRIPQTLTTNDYGDAVIAKGTTTEPFALWTDFDRCRGASVILKDIGHFCMDSSVPRGEWVEIAASYNGEEIVLIIDGEVVHKSEKTGLIGTNSQPLFIGLSPVPIDEDFEGEIDFVKLWNKGRTIEEIRKDFNRTNISVGSEGGLVGYWEFDGNLKDSTTNKNDGVFVGDAYIR